MAVTIVFANLPNGLQNMSLFDQAFAQVGPGNLPEPTIVTTASYNVPAQTSALAVERVTPTLTILNLPHVASQAGIPFRMFDWSTISADHEIRVFPAAGESIMRQSQWSFWSTSTVLTNGMLNPSVSLLGWYFAT